MGDVLFMALRRLRAPLITIICVYAVSVGGLTLIPGIGADGKPETMSFFHAFYVMSFTATTIGVGELPNPFTDAQRMWVTFSIYLSVVAWAYAVGTVFAMTNDVTFRAMLARALDRDGARLVIIEARDPRAHRIALEEFVSHPLALAADARLADVLVDAGIHSSHCAGAAIDAVNLGVTTLARRIKPDLFVAIRQNHVQDRALIEAARANLEFVQSDLVVHECLQILKTPMLGRFIAHLRGAGNELAEATHARVLEVTGERAPLAWTFECDIMQPGIFGAFFQRRGAALRLQHLLADPTNPVERLAASALALERHGEATYLPADDTDLKPGDRLLFVGDDAARALQMRYLREPGTVARVCSGFELPRSALFRWLERRGIRA